jgi:hypothetical protein
MRVALLPARYDGVVASYTLLAALGEPLRAKTGPQRADLRSDGHYQQRLDLGVPNPNDRWIDGAVRAVSHFVKILS